MVRWRIVSTVAVLVATTGMVAFRTRESPWKVTELVSPSFTRPVVAAKERGQKLPVTAQVTVGDTTLDLEVARTPQQRRLGLMYRRSLAENRGMLFLFDSPRVVRFWMKNTLIPLDMIFLRDGRVEKVVTSAPPCEVSPCPSYGMEETAVNQVIELPAGRASELGVQVGDRLMVEFLDVKPPAKSLNSPPSAPIGDEK